MATKQKNEDKTQEYLLEFNVPDDIRTLYANEMAVQDLSTEFILSFFEVRLPIVAPDAQSKKADTLKPVCVSRIAISVERVPDIIQVLQTRLDKFIKQRDLKSEEKK